MVFWTTTRNKTDHTMWKVIENCTRKWCLFLCTILFEVNWAFRKIGSIVYSALKSFVIFFQWALAQGLWVLFPPTEVVPSPEGGRPQLGLAPERGLPLGPIQVHSLTNILSWSNKKDKKDGIFHLLSNWEFFQFSVLVSVPWPNTANSNVATVKQVAFVRETDL